jgi:hypothetical protein
MDELGSFRFLERWRRDLLDLNSQLEHSLYKIIVHTSRTISRNTPRRASASPGSTSRG